MHKEENRMRPIQDRH